MNFTDSLSAHKHIIDDIRCAAHTAHSDVNQFYGNGLPYSYHLDSVAKYAIKYGHLVCDRQQDLLPLMFGAYFHDSIEDARLSYNDVSKIALSIGLSEEQAYMGVEIVYALTNEKGRTRKERANERYYEGIRLTPYAPFCKMCDRLANLAFSTQQRDKSNIHMLEVYRNELPHFITAIQPEKNIDIRLSVPDTMITEAYSLLTHQ